MTPSTGSFFFSTVALLLAILTLLSIRSGQVVSASSLIEINRVQHPLVYWAVVSLQIFGVVAFVWLAYT